MRKFTIIFVILALLFSLSVPVFAADDDDTRDTVVSFTFEVATPRYSVNIPASIELDLDGPVYLPVTVVGTDTLSGRTVVIKIADALNGEVSYLDEMEYNDDWFMVENTAANGAYYKTIAYVIGNPETHSFINFFSDSANWKACEFSADGTQNLAFTAQVDDPNLVLPNSKYTGFVVFGISLEW